MGVRPLTPQEAFAVKAAVMPDFVIESFNTMIALHMSDSGATFKKDDVVDLIKQNAELAGYEGEFAYAWLDVEGIYRNLGWKVSYDKPGYNETYPATYSFRIK